MSFLAISCDKEEDSNPNPSTNIQHPSSKLSNPSLRMNVTTTTYDDVTFRCSFDNGGDTWENMECTVHWGKYNSKQSKTPKLSDLSHHESMRQYATTSKSTTFDKAHAGFSGGTYIYYYFECKNSKYTTKTDVTYCIIKRMTIG